ncbi:sulfotransferase [Glycomyces sp. L485]|uniref:sulfotransferase family protein n=1 Tax=Glycomyces sp. L485 TaxID=2909235 RepID=UPI001F4A26A2|nr:sulfotransferase [Glycomyces sp. L485]MCH7229974.1 sulfotransferase [Glycomyces sp. L485]
MRRISAITPVVNAALAPLTIGRRDPDRAFDRLLDQAVKASGGTAVGDEVFIEDFRFLLRDFAAVEGLTSIGWLSAIGDIRSRLENRLRIRRLHATLPLRFGVIERPIVVVGLPRTATTLTHNIIARSEAHRAPLLWEWMHTDLPMEPAAEQQVIRSTRRAMRTVLRLAPAFWSIHPQDPERPDEDPFLLPHGSQHLARAPLPDYERRLADRDFGADYDYLKQALQVLQHGRPHKRWVLKSPTHLENLPELVRVFPDCTIVWMHRDPVTIVGSICSLVETSTRLHVRNPRLDEIGKMCLRLLERLIDRARESLPAIKDRVIHVPYDWLCSDPHQAVPRLYDLVGANWTGEDADALDGVLARPDRARLHEYEIARYGLDTTTIEAAFGNYGRWSTMPGPEPSHR